MPAVDQSLVSNFLNATLPTAAGGKPTATYWTAGGLSTSGAMLIRLNSSLSTASASGTQLTGGSGYTTGGSALGASSPSSAGSNVTLPAATTSWTNGGSTWSIASLDITDNAATRTWFGPFAGQPISVVNGNTFQIAAAGVVVSDS
jgi:hypothetical protein